jgi:DUF1009 family protein
MNSPLGLIAGRGELPVKVREAALAGGREVFVVRLKGFEEPALADAPGTSVGLGEVGKLIKLLRAAGCKELVFAGNVSRPDFSALKLDWRGTRLLPRVLSAARQGDDALLQLLMGVFRDEGFILRGADDIATALLAEAGLIAGPQPTSSQIADIQRGHAVAREIGRLDIGQGCVVCDGLVLAVEAQEGTDVMLARVAELPAPLRGTPEAPRGVLVKAPKPIQDRRIDLPTVGVKTLEGLWRAGLAGLAIERGGALLIEREAIVDYADAHALFVFAVEPGH